MEFVELIRAYLHIVDDTYHDTIVFPFQYLDSLENIPSWGFFGGGVAGHIFTAYGWNMWSSYMQFWRGI